MCSACLNDSDRQHPDNPSLSWSLSDKLGDYGVIVAQHAPQQPLNDEHRQLINTLVEQLTSVLAIERQVDHQQQLMLMEERAAIARELHDSIAQSLSCLENASRLPADAGRNARRPARRWCSRCAKS